MLSIGRTWIAARRENLDVVAMSVGDRVRWLQVRAQWGRASSLLGVVVTVYGLEKGLVRAGEEFGRVVAAVQVLLVLGLRVVREKMGQQLALSSLTLSASQRGSAEN